MSWRYVSFDVSKPYHRVPYASKTSHIVQYPTCCIVTHAWIGLYDGIVVGFCLVVHSCLVSWDAALLTGLTLSTRLTPAPRAPPRASSWEMERMGVADGRDRGGEKDGASHTTPRKYIPPPTYATPPIYSSSNTYHSTQLCCCINVYYSATICLSTMHPNIQHNGLCNRYIYIYIYMYISTYDVRISLYTRP